MARISEIRVKQLPAQHMLSIRKTIHFFKDYSNYMGQAIGSILPLIEQNASYPASGPVVCFHNMQLETLDVEIGFLLAQPIEATGEITAQSVPTRTVATTIDRGVYEQQDPTLEELMAWIPANGFEPAGGIYYHYLNGDEVPQECLTEMFIPVKKAVALT